MKQVGSVEVPQEAFMAVLRMDDNNTKSKMTIKALHGHYARNLLIATWTAISKGVGAR